MFGKHLGSLLLTGVVFFGAVTTEDCGPDPDPVPACREGAQRQVVSPEGVAGIEVCVGGQWVYYPAQ